MKVKIAHVDAMDGNEIEYGFDVFFEENKKGNLIWGIADEISKETGWDFEDIMEYTPKDLEDAQNYVESAYRGYGWSLEMYEVDELDFFDKYDIHQLTAIDDVLKEFGKLPTVSPETRIKMAEWREAAIAEMEKQLNRMEEEMRDV